ncbi:MAG: hypothetical protein QNJ32_08385 [Xenococcaceae cyanobacterium MO_167.B27]|nr:hypothetical protein [Xenococcaceae cyanobacterium MO_167.B27]
MKSRKVFKLSSTLLIFSLSLSPLIVTKSQAHIKCPIKEPIFGTTNDTCPHPPHLEDLSEEAWGEGGRIAYVSAAATMARRSPTGESLDVSLKNALRPHFGGLVDRVTLHWGTPGLDKWSANQIGIHLSGTESDGQTYGHDIYLDLQKPSSYSQYVVKLIIHEMVHSDQYEKWGSSLSNFGYHYFKNYKKVGQNYENNKLEKEAEERANSLYQSVYASLNQRQSSTVDDSPKQATSKLWVRNATSNNENWIEIGHANNVVAMAGVNGQLFAATRDNKLWIRNATSNNENWIEIGHANNVVAMVGINGQLFVTTP